MNQDLREIDKIFRTADLSDPFVRIEAICKIRRLPLPTLETCATEFLQHPSELLRAEVLLILGSHNPQKYHHMLCYHLSKDSSGLVRAFCAMLLDRSLVQTCSEVLLKTLQDPDWRVISATLAKVYYLDAPQKIPFLLRLLEHESWHIRLKSCTVLVRSGVANSRIMEVLHELKRHPEIPAYNQEINSFQRTNPEMLEGLFRGATIETLIAEAQQLLE